LEVNVNKLHRLRLITKPLTESEVTEIVDLRYGKMRENISADDPVSAQLAADLTRRIAENEEKLSTQNPD
jgi:hypothetical protein